MLTLIVLLLSAVILWQWDFFPKQHCFDWFDKYQKLFNISNNYLQLICLLLPILIFSGVVLTLFHGFGFNVFYLLLNLIIFISCLGPGNILKDVKEDNNNTKLGETIIRQIFAVIFWFIVLGPVMILLYRGLDIIKIKNNNSLGETAEKLLTWLDWIPMRLFIVLMGLVGDFSKSMVFIKNGEITQCINKNSTDGETPLVLIQHALSAGIILYALLAIAGCLF